MTSPQSDPAQDVPAAIARLTEQTIGLQRQATRLEAVLTERDHVFQALLHDSEQAIRELTNARFVTYDAMLRGETERRALALEATEKAIGKAEAANEKRFESVNEFRGQLADQTRTFMPRIEVQQLLDQLTLRLGELNDRMNRQEGILHGANANKTGLYAALAAATAVIIAIVVVINLVTSHS